MTEIYSAADWRSLGRSVPKGTVPVDTETSDVYTLGSRGSRCRTVTTELFSESQVKITPYGRLIDLAAEHGLTVDKSDCVPGMLEVSPDAETDPDSDGSKCHAMLIEGKWYCGIKFYGGTSEALRDLPAMLPPTIQIVDDSQLEREPWYGQE